MNWHPRSPRAPVPGLRAAVALLVLAVVSSLAGAGESLRVKFNIPGGDAASTLKKFVAQSHVQLVYPVDEVRGENTRAVRGKYTPREALERLLTGTDLRLVEDAFTGAFAVNRMKTPAVDGAVADPVTVDQAEERMLGPIYLSPFEILENEADSYASLDSNSLTSFRLGIERMPATTQSFTRTFMDDVGATSIEDVLTGYSGVATAATGTPSSQLDMPGDRNGAGGISIRGVAVGDIKRDGFIGPTTSARTASGYTDNFSIERVELIEGPQSILFGSVGGGGVVNTISKRAEFGRQSGAVRYAVDQYGSKRALMDFNLGEDRLALRFAGVRHDRQTERYRLGSELAGVYLQFAARLAPQTTVRLYTERTNTLARVAFKPNLSAFLALGDPRHGVDARYLALTGQLGGLDFIDGGVTYENLESLASWWSSERIETEWSGLTVESRLPWGFSGQLTAIYVDTLDLRAINGRALVPARGLTGSEVNPYDVTAVRIGSPVKVNEQRDRNRGARLSFVHKGRINLGRVRGEAQTALGGQFFDRGPSFGSSGITKAYYLADANWNPIVDPNVSLDYGRVPLTSIYFPVQSSVPEQPVFRPGAARVVLDGRNYVLMPRILSDPARATPANPYGLIPNNPTPENPNGFVDTWNLGAETRSLSVFAANFTGWLDGRLTTLAGCSFTRFESRNIGAGNIAGSVRSSHAAWQFGGTWEIRPGIRLYAVTGTAEHSEASTNDIYGVPLRNPRAVSPVPEVGLKIATGDDRLSLQVSVSPKTKTLNEDKNTGDTSFLDAINPDGINGRLGGNAANQRVNLDRTLTAASVVLTAHLAPTWRMRLLASRLGGEVSRTVGYRQLYNDEFHTIGDMVTYADRTAVMVDPTGSGGAATTPLTLAMINDPSSAFFASPDPVSGTITNETLRAALMAPDAQHGTAATGRTGLPIASIQYEFSSPYPDGNVVIYQAGEKNTGFNELSFNLQSHHTFSTGILNGFGIFADLQVQARNRAYYANFPDATGSTLGTRTTRRLVRLPDLFVTNLGLSYRRKLTERIEWSTQLNIRNLFNHSEVWVVPSSGNGSMLQARLSAQPRQFVWTNSVHF